MQEQTLGGVVLFVLSQQLTGWSAHIESCVFLSVWVIQLQGVLYVSDNTQCACTEQVRPQCGLA